jgi:hypothetical protein
MGFNFPNAPLEGQVYQPPGGPTYTYRSPVWEATGEGIAAPAELYYDPVRSNTLFAPPIDANATDYDGYPPDEEPDRFFNTVIAPGFGGYNEGQDIRQTALFGLNVGRVLQTSLYTDAFGTDALKHARHSQRNTLIGTLAGAWFGQDLTSDSSINPAYPAVPRYYEHEMLNNNGLVWTNPAWDVFGIKTKSPGVVARISAWVASNPWADNKAAAAPGTAPNDYILANVVVGRDALNLMTVGTFNTAVGYHAQCLLLEGNFNTALGYDAGFYGSIGAAAAPVNGNTAIGTFANRDNQDGGFNTALGYRTGNGVQHGGSNLYLGTGAGTIANYAATVDVTMNRCVFIGASSGSEITATTINDKLYVGNSASRGPLIAGDFATGQVAVGLIPLSAAMDWKMRNATLTVYSGASGVGALAATVDDFVIEGSTSTGMTIATPNTSTASIYFTDPESQFAGYVQYNHSSDYLRFGVNATERLRLTASGIGFNGSAGIAKPSITGSKGANAALTSLLTNLASMGLITDSTT